MNDVKFLSKISRYRDIDKLMALLNAHIIKNTRMEKARLGMFAYNKVLGAFIKNNFSFMEELSKKSYEKYHMMQFTTNMEKSMAANPKIYEEMMDKYEELESEA